jgi:hypothetical protein
MPEAGSAEITAYKVFIVVALTSAGVMRYDAMQSGLGTMTKNTRHAYQHA